MTFWAAFVATILMLAYLMIQIQELKMMTQYMPKARTETNDRSIPQVLKTTDTKPETSKLSSNTKCISFSNDIETLFNTTIKQVYITTPAKTGGSSLKNFTKACMGKERTIPIDNYINWSKKPELVTGTSSLTPPSIITGHVFNDDAMVNIIQSMTDESITLYTYRHESDRLLSAIRHVVARLCKDKNITLEKYVPHVKHTDTECSIEQHALVDIIREQRLEIGFSVYNTLTCRVFDSIEENRPNFVLVHYKQVNRVRDILAKYHCPEFRNYTINSPIVAKDMDIFVNIPKQGSKSEKVSLSTWLKEKRQVLQFSLDLKRKVTCQGKLRSIEKKLLSCEDELLQFTTDH